MSDRGKVIILGNSGFIGSYLQQVLSLSREVVGWSKSDVDLTLPGALTPFAAQFSQDSTLVLAAAVKRQFGDTLEAFEQNMAIVENVCHLLEANPIRRVIFLSSAAVYGEETENVSICEESSVDPTSFYGIAKYSAERLLKKVCAGNGRTSLVCLRPPLIYGCGDQGNTYGPAGFSTAAIKGQPITLWGDGSELREFMYIEDVCRLIDHLTDSEFTGELNAVSGVSYCFADVIDILQKEFPNLNVNSRPRSKEKVDNAFDPSRIKSILPAEFRFTPLEVGMAHILNATGGR